MSGDDAARSGKGASGGGRAVSPKRIAMTAGLVVLLAIVGSDVRILLVGVPAAIAVGILTLADARA